jgi:hypothetical protein
VNESEWLTCTNLPPMLVFLRGKATDRKLRLFFCACGRRIWPMLTQSEYQEAVEVGERYADGQATSKQLQQAYRRVSEQYWPAALPSPDQPSPFQEKISTGHIVVWAAIANEQLLDWSTRMTPSLVRMRLMDVEPAQCCILQEIIGNPFRPVVFDPAWRTPTVTALATAAYDERSLPAGTLDADRLAVLADALDDAGCTDEQILAHLREPSPHVRGCWAIDLLLGKE